jgi:hypothetical protein
LLHRYHRKSRGRVVRLCRRRGALQTVVGEGIMILRTAICLAAMMLLEGCAAGLLTAGAVTEFAVDKSVDQGARYGIRRLDNSMQARIAAAAGPLGVGYAASWDSPETIPILYPAHSGMVEVVRIFGRLTSCKEVIFTIKDNYNVFTTTICRNDVGDWAWALAEPSIHR